MERQTGQNQFLCMFVNVPPPPHDTVCFHHHCELLNTKRATDLMTKQGGSKSVNSFTLVTFQRNYQNMQVT